MARQSPFEGPVARIISITNVGGSVYAIQFSEPVTVTSTSGVEYNILMYSPTIGAGWNPVQWTTLGTSTAHGVLNTDSDADCTLIAILQQPQYATAADAFQTAGPLGIVS